MPSRNEIGNSSSEVADTKTRRGISVAERRQLRAWYQGQIPKPTHKVCRTWFLAQFNHPISQSTVSESLSSRFSNLDSSNALSGTTVHKRRKNLWPKLEAILFDWQQQLGQKNISVSADLLIAKAKEIWPQIPEYSTQVEPSWSLGWVEKFKKRHGIQRQASQGKSRPTLEPAADTMVIVRTLCGEYDDDNIYTMGETGLLWRSVISEEFSTQPVPGAKKNDSRVSVALAVNAAGTDKLPPLIIGRTKRPIALRRVNLEAMGAVWRSNPRACMQTDIMNLWLKRFYHRIGSTRKVLLLLDDLASHKRAVDETPPPPNVRIQILPSDGLSRYQPLDLGIIQNFKIHYRKKWLSYQIHHFERGIDPYKAVTPAHLVRWTVESWQYDVSTSCIYNCFRKSTMIGFGLPQLPAEPIIDISYIYNEACKKGRILRARLLSDFLNPHGEDEDFDDEPEQEETTATHYYEAEDDDEADIEEAEELETPTVNEALRATQLLLRFQERQDDAQTTDISYLTTLARKLLAIQARSLTLS